MNGASVPVTGLDHPVVNLGVFRMSYLRRAIAAAVMSLATLAPAGFASAADMAAKAKPIIDVPFFFVIDNRVTYSYIFSGTDPGMFTVRPNGTIDGKTEKQVFSVLASMPTSNDTLCSGPTLKALVLKISLKPNVLRNRP